MAIDGNTLRELAIKVSQYFLDFLESDFKRQQAPRRHIVLQTETGFRSGMKVATYLGLQNMPAGWTLQDHFKSLAADHVQQNERRACRPFRAAFQL